jgi:membrane associated rhomboid family serine protease
MSIWGKIREMCFDKSVRWYFGISLGAIIFVFSSTALFLLSGGSLETVSQNEIYDMSKTLLSIDATLFGLSAVVGGLLAVACTRKEMREMFLHSRILELVGISFLCFWLAMIFAFYSLVFPSNKNGLTISIGATISGSVSGSIYLLYTFRNFLLSENRQKEEKKE